MGYVVLVLVWYWYGIGNEICKYLIHSIGIGIVHAGYRYILIGVGEWIVST